MAWMMKSQIVILSWANLKEFGYGE